MIFFDGKIYENDMCDKLLARFEDMNMRHSRKLSAFC